MSTAPQRQHRAYPRIELRLATLNDIEQIVMLAMTLLRESPTYNKLFPCDPAATAKHLRLAIGTGFAPYIVAVHEGRIIGTISVSQDDSFSDGKCTVMGDMFVYREFRKTFVGRALMMAAMDMAKRSGAVAMHIPIAGGHEAVPTLVNMLKKFGAEEIGVIMRKVL
jgi:GNAT superfamily N-acetyltransferase